MGKRGPKREPSNLTALRGNPGHRAKNNKEPRPKELKGKLSPPRLIPLDATGKKVWKHLAPALQQYGLLTEIDDLVLARYCDVFSKWLKAKAFIDEHGETYTKYGEEIELPDGTKTREVQYVGQYPQSANYKHLTKSLKDLEDRFGMTPSARSSIHIEIAGGVKPKDKRQSEVKGFLFGV